MRTIFEARNWASSFLDQHNREVRVAELMLRHLLQKDLKDWLASLHEELPEHLWVKYQQWIKEHAQTGKPIEHFTNEANFYGRTFYVNEHVLIPRPETEELVHAVINEIQSGDTIVDIGTGSGAIAISIKKEKPSIFVYATDLSQKALKVAKKNALSLKADVQFIEGSFLEPIIENKLIPDVIVSNPPYIPLKEREVLSETVLHDPELALFAEQNGLQAYDTIISQVAMLKRKPRLIAFEIGYDQGETVPALINRYEPESIVNVLKDINGKDRIVLWKN